LRYLIESHAHKGYRFLGGFFGARMYTGTEYSGWVFITDPTCEYYQYFVLPIYQKYLDFFFSYDPIFIQTIQLWTKEGWDIISILLGIQKEEKALQYYPTNKYLPFVVLRQQKEPIIIRPTTNSEEEIEEQKEASPPLILKNFPTIKSSPEFSGGKDDVGDNKREIHILSARDYSSNTRKIDQNTRKAKKTKSASRIPKLPEKKINVVTQEKNT